MAGLLDKYGIKEVADVIFYDINADGTINYASPVLYLDTLKVSTIEQTAENVSARGGKGNPELITWDYNKEITVTLEDALFSAKSLAMMFGTLANPNNNVITKAVPYGDIISNNSTTVYRYGNQQIACSISYYILKDTGTTTPTKPEATANIAAVVISFTPSQAYTITIDSNKFPGTYAVVGETFARSEATGDDEFFQFIIYKAKVTSEVTFTLEAEGDPTTFSMNLKVLRPSNGNTMMRLIKYNLVTQEDSTAALMTRGYAYHEVYPVVGTSVSAADKYYTYDSTTDAYTAFTGSVTQDTAQLYRQDTIKG